jgi:outer membrane protein TolC
MGAAPDERLSIGEDVLAEFATAGESKAVDELYREALAQRLEIQALDKSQAALSDARSVEASRALPRFEAFGNVTYANPNPRIFPQEERWSATWDVGLQLVWAVNDLGTAGTTARSVRSQVAQLEHQQTGVERALRVEVVNALGSLEQARLNVSTAEQGQRAADAAYAAREQLQAQGMGTTLELMQAETVRIRARLNVINAHIALRVARVQLDHAVGRDVRP